MMAGCGGRWDEGRFENEARRQELVYEIGQRVDGTGSAFFHELKADSFFSVQLSL